MRTVRSRLRNRCEYLAYLGARALAHRVGPVALARLGTLCGELYLVSGRRRRKIIDFNLGLAFPELDRNGKKRLARRVARHFGRVSLDALRVQRLGPEELLREVRVEGRENLRGALQRGQGLFLLSAHIGSWEVAALVAGLLIPQGFAMVNRPLDNPLLETELARLRGPFGNRALGKDSVTRDMLRQLRAGGGLGILIDQRTLEREGVQVPFFGQPSWTHAGLGRLFARTGAPVVPIWGLWDGPGRYTVRFDPPLLREEIARDQRDVVSLTARFMAIIEQVIRERPEQWLWFHDRWRQLRAQRAREFDVV